MKKDKVLKICGFSIGCIASFMAGFSLKKDHFDKMITNNVISYYDEYSHIINETYTINEDAFKNNKIDINNIELNIPNGYIITGFHYDETKSNYLKVSYINNIDVIDMNDGSLFGIPINELNQDYSRAAKRLYLKSH